MQTLIDSLGAALQLGLTTREVERLARQRRIPFVQLPDVHDVRFDPHDLDDWVRQFKVTPAEPAETITA